MNMTYKQLLAYLQAMSQERLDDNITIRDTDSDEYIPVQAIEVADVPDVLDKGHVYLVLVNKE